MFSCGTSNFQFPVSNLAGTQVARLAGMSAFYFFSFTLIFFCVFAFAEDNPDDRNEGRAQQDTAPEANEQPQQANHGQVFTS